MKRRLVALLTELLLLAAGVELVVLAPDVALSILVAAIPILLVAAGLSVLYLARVYYRQTTPRSRFFGMMLGISGRVEIAFLWVAYLVLGRIGERTGWYDLPTPPPAVSSPISGLVACLAIAPPIFYAIAIWRIRRAASRLAPGGEDLVDLERDV